MDPKSPLDLTETQETTGAGDLADTASRVPSAEKESRVALERSRQVPPRKADRQITGYIAERVVGVGVHGTVYLAVIRNRSERVAIKRILIDRNIKSRELHLLRMMRHPNIVELRQFFYTSNEKGDDAYLNLVMDYIPETLFMIINNANKAKHSIPVFAIKLYAYQMFRGLAYIHAHGICHRDIKPQNLLVDQSQGTLKICDFSSAKMLNRGETNISYICSRYYRAPELIFGSSAYSTAIDTWAAGCVVAEMVLGRPLFQGESSVDQLVEVIKVLGTPSKEDIILMNPNYTEFKFPQIKSQFWGKVFKPRTPPEIVDLVARSVVYSPLSRIRALDALAHNCFDELREVANKIFPVKQIPQLFDFEQIELKGASPELIRRLVPEHYAYQLSLPISQLIANVTALETHQLPDFLQQSPVLKAASPLPHFSASIN